MPELHLMLGGGTKIPAVPGDTVLSAVLRTEHNIQTVCKGRGMCGACRVLVDEEFLSRLTPPSKTEERLLRYLAQGAANHRLACQITLDESLSGLRVTPAPLPIRTVAKETTA